MLRSMGRMVGQPPCRTSKCSQRGPQDTPACKGRRQGGRRAPFQARPLYSRQMPDKRAFVQDPCPSLHSTAHTQVAQPAHLHLEQPQQAVLRASAAAAGKSWGFKRCPAFSCTDARLRRAHDCTESDNSSSNSAEGQAHEK